MKRNIIKKIIFILIIILAILLIIFCRRIYVVNKVLNLAEENNFENYHIKLYTYNADSTNSIEVFKNNNERISNFKNLSALYQSSSYVDDTTGECIQIVTTDSGKKAYVGNTKDIMGPMVELTSTNTKSILEINNTFNILLKIKSLKIEECNGKQCYYFRINSNSRNINIWIDKETGLVIRNMTAISESENNGKINIVQDWIYSFNTVTENDVIKPNLDGIEVESR